MLSSIPEIIRQRLEKALKTPLLDFSPCSGGCINHGGKLVTGGQNYFIKWNDAAKFPSMFLAEQKGLAILRKANAIATPEVCFTDEIDGWQFIVMEFIEGGVKSTSYWSDLGHQLSALHRVSQHQFGLDHHNFIGSLKQFNTWKSDWITFFVENRLEIQIRLAADTGKISNRIVSQFETLCKKLSDLLPQAKPSLMHGDLWSGNLIVTKNGDPCLIDPAIYYGNREAEIAFTALFGGFATTFYDAYFESDPVPPGFDRRIDIYNLYPLLVHVNLFGGSYLSQVVSILNHYV